MLVGDYDELKRELFEKFREIEDAVKSVGQLDVGVPAPASNEVRYAGFHYIKADEELSNGHKEKAVEEMQRAVRHVHRALFTMQRFLFLFYLENARSVYAELRENEDVASSYIPNYEERKKNLFEISKREEDAKSYDEDSPEAQDFYKKKIKNVQAFLDDFEANKIALFATIDKRSVLRGKTVRVLMAVIAAILGAIIGALFTIARAG